MRVGGCGVEFGKRGPEGPARERERARWSERRGSGSFSAAATTHWKQGHSPDRIQHGLHAISFRRRQRSGGARLKPVLNWWRARFRPTHRTQASRAYRTAWWPRTRPRGSSNSGARKAERSSSFRGEGTPSTTPPDGVKISGPLRTESYIFP